MSWRVGSPIYVAQGATIRVGFEWGRPGDRGPQWAMGHPMKGEPPTALATERVAKRVDCEIGRLVINGDAQYSCHEPSTYWAYYVDITNTGTYGCRFQLEGGGV